jgi:hypothetical protein
MINFELNIENYDELKDLTILEYNNLLSDDIKKLITYFNTEYTWDSMFDYDEVKNRIENGHFLYILYYGHECIGYVFFEPKENNEFYLYNLYVTNVVKRPKYSPIWFVNKVLQKLPHPFTKITCRCEDWHNDAQNVFKSNGFTIVS